MRERHPSSPRFEHFFETTNDLLAVLDPDGKFVYTNPAFREMLGYTLESLVGRSLIELVMPEDEPAVRSALACFGTSDSARIQARVRQRDRTSRAVDFSFRYVADEGAMYVVGRDVGLVGEEDTRRAAVLLQHTQALANVGGWELNCRTMELFWTEETYRIHEVPIDFTPNLEGGVAFYAPESIPIISSAVEACMTRGQPFDHELELVTYKKRRIWVRAVGVAHFEDGKVTRILGAFQDIDERKRRSLELEAQLQIIEQQRSVIHAMSAPIIQVWDGVLALPIVGMLDEIRVADITVRLLEDVVRLAATQVILDLTGVESVDEATADYLVRIIRATQLLGAQAIITGVRPAVARTLVMLGADLGRTVMRSNLREAIKAAMRADVGDRAARGHDDSSPK